MCFNFRIGIALLAMSWPLLAQANRALRGAQDKAEADLRLRVEASPKLPFEGMRFVAKPPVVGWRSGSVSGVAVDGTGTIYEIQRGNKADPVLVLDGKGKVLRSWGAGDYTIPHSVRIDPAGNIWTVDAGSSTVVKYSPRGRKLMTIVVGGQPENGSSFSGTTDIAFAPNGHLYIADGYGNARVLEYTSDGKRISQWGKFGSGPGEFNLPHAIQIDEQGTVYVADRENGRIEKFDLSGNYLGEIPNLGGLLAQACGQSIVGHDPTVQPACYVGRLDRKA